MDTFAPRGVTLIENLGSIISAVIGVAFLLAFLIFLVMLIIGGIQWISSGGDKESVQKAKDRITHALIGLVIVACTWAIIQIVQNFFCINIFGSIKLPSAVEGKAESVSGRCGGKANGGSGSGGSDGYGIRACPCYNGGCAQNGATALGNAPGADTCFRCTNSGWQAIAGSNRNQCLAISCSKCP